MESGYQKVIQLSLGNNIKKTIMGYNMKRGNSAVPFKELGSSPAKQTIKRRAGDDATVYSDKDKTIVKADDEKETYTTSKTKFYNYDGTTYKPGEDIDEGELSEIKEKDTSKAHVLHGKKKLYLNPAYQSSEEIDE